MPAVPLDDDLLAALSVGLPIGLGIYFAWVNRDWSGQTKIIGLAAAAGGSLLGAWLAFHATEGFIALITTIVGRQSAETCCCSHSTYRGIGKSVIISSSPALLPISRL
jgi:hypothetical protein